MEEIRYSAARNGGRTCTLNGIHLHSSYDPEKEAARFAESLRPDFSPAAVIVAEPALSYCARHLREKFPGARLGAIRFTDGFKEQDGEWDFAVGAERIDSLQEILGEDALLSALFVAWPPSQKAFPKESDEARLGIRRLVRTSGDILATREYFGERWTRNTIRFCAFAERTLTIRRGSCPVLIAASGPSLKESLPHLESHRNSFFLVALSSAYAPLADAGITPDLCVSTDGGYWAKRHLENCVVPVALSAESAAPHRILASGTVVPLCYGDGPEAALLRTCGFSALGAKRNGTVSGTAAELALAITSGPVLACGLDLAAGNGFQHAQPNALEAGRLAGDFRLRPKETRLYPSQLPNAALEVYRQWFSTRTGELADRFFRLTARSRPHTDGLGGIKTLFWDEAASLIGGAGKERVMPPSFTETRLPGRKERLRRIKGFLGQMERGNPPVEWISTLLPAEFASYKRSTDKAAAAASLRKKHEEKMRRLKEFAAALERAR